MMNKIKCENLHNCWAFYHYELQIHHAIWAPLQMCQEKQIEKEVLLVSNSKDSPK